MSINAFSHYFNSKNIYNLKIKMGYQIIHLKIIIFNPNLKYF